MYAIVERGRIRETLGGEKSFELNGLKYAKNVWTLWSTSDLNAIGCFVVVEDNSNYKDSSFYTNTDPICTYDADAKTVTQTYGTAKEQDLKTIKAREKSTIKWDAHNLLLRSDWEIIRAAEKHLGKGKLSKEEIDESVSSATIKYRVSVRKKSNEMETAITKASDMSALLTLLTRDRDGVRPIGDLPTS